MKGIEVETVIRDSKLKWLTPIFENWIQVNLDYIEYQKYDDALYWYNERANISALAGAIWRSGGLAIEEYSAMKGDAKNRINGRIDLYFSLKEKAALVEAKMAWLYLSNRSTKTLESVLNASLSAAMNDINKTIAAKDNAEKYNFGISFIVPYWKNGYSQKDADQKMKDLKKALKKSKCDFYVFFKNTSAKHIVSLKENVCDSVIMVGRRA